MSPYFCIHRTQSRSSKDHNAGDEAACESLDCSVRLLKEYSKHKPLRRLTYLKRLKRNMRQIELWRWACCIQCRLLIRGEDHIQNFFEAGGVIRKWEVVIQTLQVDVIFFRFICLPSLFTCTRRLNTDLSFTISSSEMRRKCREAIAVLCQVTAHIVRDGYHMKAIPDRTYDFQAIRELGSCLDNTYSCHCSTRNGWDRDLDYTAGDVSLQHSP